MIKMTDKQAADIAYLKMMYNDVYLLENGEYLVSTVREIFDIIDDDKDLGEIYLLNSNFEFKAIYDYDNTFKIRKIKSQNPCIGSLETIDSGVIDRNKYEIDPPVMFQVVENPGDHIEREIDCSSNDLGIIKKKDRYVTEIVGTDGTVLNLWDKTGSALKTIESNKVIKLPSGEIRNNPRTDAIKSLDNIIWNELNLYSAKYYIPEHDDNGKFIGYNKRVQVIYKDQQDRDIILIRGDTDIYKFLVNETDGRHLYIYGVPSNIVIDYNISTADVKSESINKATILNRRRYCFTCNIKKDEEDPEDRLNDYGLCAFIDRLLLTDEQVNNKQNRYYKQGYLPGLIKHTMTVHGSTYKIYTKDKVFYDKTESRKTLADKLDDRFEFLDTDNMIYLDKQTNKIYIASLGDFYHPFNGLMMEFTESMNANEFEDGLDYHTYSSGKQVGSEENSNRKLRLITSIGSKYFVNRSGWALDLYRLESIEDNDLSKIGITDRLVKVDSVGEKLGSNLDAFRSRGMNISAGARVLKDKPAYVIEAKPYESENLISGDSPVAEWFKAFYFDSGLTIEYEVDKKYLDEQHKDNFGFKKVKYNAVSCRDIDNNNKELSLSDPRMTDLKEIISFRDLGMIGTSAEILDTNKLKQLVKAVDFGKRMMMDLELG